MSAVSRGTWKSNTGFILAAVGGAVGLGNLWGFSYSASQGGGAAFVVLYLFFVLSVGLPVLTAELVIGRHTGQSPIRAMGAIASRWKWLGVVFVAVGFGILSFYSVIMGWTGRMLLDFALGWVPSDTGTYFGQISEGGDAVFAHALGMILTILIIAGGVQHGIERVAVVLMPVLFLLLIGLAIWAATLSGAGAGYGFYLKPDFSAVFRQPTVTGAAGQAFFSLSLGMGAMITYASYLGGKGSIPGKAVAIAGADTLVAFVGGMVTFPIIFHFDLLADVNESTIGALFIAVPRGFLEMSFAGRLVGTFFFLALYIAAITSAISLLEVCTSAFIDSLGWERKKTAWILGILIAIAGMPSALSTEWVGFLFALLGQVFLIFGGLMLALITGYFWSGTALEELRRGFDSAALATLWIWLLRTVVPLALLVVLYFSISQTVIPAAKALFGASS
ncbi:MAG: sodium-dependent transporter [Acidobacteriota bacterium]|nr:MAG: sodium-dependent transporter [Acidobacteriota bacterium]